MLNGQYTLLPEWAEQEAILLAWPHSNTDWVDNLLEVQDTYINIIKAINQSDTAVVLLCAPNEAKSLLKRFSNNSMVLIVPADYNDTWLRDYGFLTVSDGEANYPMSYVFNGWGQKFDAQLDNTINQQIVHLCQQDLINNTVVLEGGAIEIDENQHLLSTASCLMNQRRNENMSLEDYEQMFRHHLGAKKVTIFSQGMLEGDDTDGHVDTLLRFTPLMGIVVQGAKNRVNDRHFPELLKLEEEVKQCLPQHKIYSLPLPFVENEQGDRLPASYANFLITNRHVLVPTYREQEDDVAMSIIQKAYPNYKVIGIECRSLVEQNGSLHCITMQVPTSTFKPAIIEKARAGVSIYE